MSYEYEPGYYVAEWKSRVAYMLILEAAGAWSFSVGWKVCGFICISLGMAFLSALFDDWRADQREMRKKELADAVEQALKRRGL
ncbi:MAG TPA: hypothetical protein VGI93_20355 [Steroidobacteraceae bacterium]|jgi:hypothetical protein